MVRTSGDWKRSWVVALSVVFPIFTFTLARCISTGAGSKSAPSADWKICANDTYGYRVEYPSTWNLIEAAPLATTEAFEAKYFLIENEMQKVTFVERDNQFWPAEFQIRVLSNPNSLSLDKWVDHFDVEDVSGGTMIQGKKTTALSGKPAFQLAIFGFDHQETAIVSAADSGLIIFLSFESESPNDPQFKKHLEIYRHVLGSFKFKEKRD